MSAPIEKSLAQLRNTRDLRAEILSVASQLLGNARTGRITIQRPVVSAATVYKEWEELRKVLLPEIRRRMSLTVIEDPSKHRSSDGGANEAWLHRQVARDQIKVDRPNYRYEVLRLLLDAHLARRPPPTLAQLIATLGVSQTPVRDALEKLKRAGVLIRWQREQHFDFDVMTQELLGKVQALPQVLRFRFAAGAAPRSQTALLQRARDLLRQRDRNGWKIFALSGVAVAHEDLPQLDLMGSPRLDLTAHLPRASSHFNVGWLRQLDDGLELEPSILAPAPVAVTLVRSDSRFSRDDRPGSHDRATRADVFLSLLDLGLRAQAIQYAKQRP